MIDPQLHQKIAARLSLVSPAIPVGISNRHVHLAQQDVEALFGKGYTLTPLKPLRQPGQFAAEECVTVVGPKGSLTRVRVLGPTRPVSQLEISRADWSVSQASWKIPAAPCSSAPPATWSCALR